MTNGVVAKTCRHLRHLIVTRDDCDEGWSRDFVSSVPSGAITPGITSVMCLVLARVDCWVREGSAESVTDDSSSSSKIMASNSGACMVLKLSSTCRLFIHRRYIL